MARHTPAPPRHQLVDIRDAERLTGLSANDLLMERDVQELVRVDPNGKRARMLRVPTTLLLEFAETAEAV